MTTTDAPTTAECYIRGQFKSATGGDARIEDLCVLALERAMIRGEMIFVPIGVPYDTEAPNWRTADSPGDPTTKLRPLFFLEGNRCRHVVDWIASSVLADEPWLKRTDDAGRPLKLLKIGSLDRAVAEADKAMRRFASRAASTPALESDETPHADLGDGWRLVRLLTPTALDRESALMQHCIGQGSYDARLDDGATLFLSLRDPSGRPHATLEMRRRSEDMRYEVLQLQGKQNAAPVARHVRRIRPWLRENALTRGRDGVFEWWSGFCHALGGRVVDLLDPPSVLWTLSSVSFLLEEGDVLPTDAIEASGIDIEIGRSRTSPVVLPARLESGHVRFSGRGVLVFGNRFTVRRLTTSGCRLENMPSGFLVRESSTLEDTTVDAIPIGADFGRILAPGSRLRLPDGYSASALDLRNSLVEKLPDGLSVRELLVGSCPIREIPEGTSAGFLHIEGSSVRRVGRPASLGTLRLLDVSSNLELPDGLVVEKDMIVIGPGFPARLPSGLRVRGHLHVERAPGVLLPEGLDVGQLLLKGNSAKRIAHGTRVRENLDLSDSDGIDVGEGCEIGSVCVYDEDRAGEPGRPEMWRVLKFDPSISRIEADGSVSRRDEAPSF